MITSKHNPLVAHINRLQTDKPYRHKHSQYILENPKNIQDIVRNASHLILKIIHSIPLPFNRPDLDTQEVDPELMTKLSSLKTPPGILAILKMTDVPIADALKSSPAIWVLDQVSDPANVGAIIRNAAAFNVPTILLTQGCADPYHPKAIQASASHVTRTHCYFIDASIWKALITPAFTLITLNSNVKTTLSSYTPTPNTPYAVIFGSEGTGVTTSYITQSPQTQLKIPTHPTVDSLNVAVTSGIVGAHFSTLSSF